MSGLRTDQSNMSGRGYAGYVTGGLGDTVLEVEGESDMQEIAAGGKSAKMLLGSCADASGMEAEEKMNMEPVLQELKCAMIPSCTVFRSSIQEPCHLAREYRESFPCSY